MGNTSIKVSTYLVYKNWPKLHQNYTNLQMYIFWNPKKGPRTIIVWHLTTQTLWYNIYTKNYDKSEPKNLGNLVTKHGHNGTKNSTTHI